MKRTIFFGNYNSVAKALELGQSSSVAKALELSQSFSIAIKLVRWVRYLRSAYPET